MILKDLMEEKQLNFNQPLLSVRRSERKTDNSLARLPLLPSYKSELKSGPVRIAGNVPFEWEKVPGRPKDQAESHTRAAVEKNPPVAPNFPPGRCGSNVSNYQSIIASLDKEKASVDDSDDDGDETFLDALETLSRTESFFVSSSVNGTSGSDDQEVQKSRSFLSSDDHQQQARDFIIGRFLPAAKAMISEAHQYGSSRKLVVGNEQQKPAKKSASDEKSIPLNQQHKLKTLPHYSCDVSESYAAAGCGLFPRLCLLNPIPGLRVEDKAQSSAVHGMQAKPIASHSETAKENARTPYYAKKSVDSGFTEEKDILCVSENFKHGADQHESSYEESPIVEKTLYVDSARKVKAHSSSGSSETKCQTSNKNPLNESSLENAASQPKSLEPLDSHFLVCSGNSSNYDMKMEMTKRSSQGSEFDKDSVSSPKLSECKKKIALKRKMSSIQKSPDSLTENSEAVKLVDKECTHHDGKIDLESQCLKKLGHQEEKTPDAASNMQVPLELPSLKAPSESWLKRALPTVSSKNIYSRPNLNANICATSQAHNTEPEPSYPNWETIVKSSNVHNGYKRFPEEVLTTIPEA